MYKFLKILRDGNSLLTVVSNILLYITNNEYLNYKEMINALEYYIYLYIYF